MFGIPLLQSHATPTVRQQERSSYFWTPPNVEPPTRVGVRETARATSQRRVRREGVESHRSAVSGHRSPIPPTLRIEGYQGAHHACASPVRCLPRVQLYQDQEVREVNPLPTICSLCLENFIPLSIVTDLTCSHLFHHNCLVQWIVRRNSCPLCRVAVTEPPASRSNF